jgi:hypothetical protein
LSENWRAVGNPSMQYVGLKATFFSIAGHRLQEAELTAPTMRTYGPMANYHYARYALIPEGAATVLLSADLPSVGKRGTISGSIGGGGLMIGSTFVPLLGGNRPVDFTLSLYGEAVVLVTTDPPRQ